VTAAPVVACAQVSHETNVFSVVPTDFAAFSASHLLLGGDIAPALRGSNTEIGGFLDGSTREGFDLRPIVAVWATPSGLVTADALERLAAILESGVRELLAEGPLWGVLLALHGSMVSETDPDGDAFLLERVRAVVGPRVPVVSTLDLHANISHRMVAAADVLIGYDTYPHVDMAERGQEACRLLGRLVRGEVHPVSALRKPPMLPTSQRMTTDRMPMRALMERAHAVEDDPRVLNVTVAGGFPPADVPEAGFGVLVTTDNDQALAEEMAEALARESWELRAGFLGGVTAWEDAISLMRTLDDPEHGGGPVVLVDIADNPWTGGPGDSAELVRCLLNNRVHGAAVALVRDPEIVAAAAAAGPGGAFEGLLGGKTDDLHGTPLPIQAYVRLLSDGRYVNDGPMLAGVAVDLGPTAVLRVVPPGEPGLPPVEVLVTTRAETPIDLNVFRAHGIEPTRRRVLGLKGKGHFRAAFEPIARRVILVEGPGITGADLSRLRFRHVRRPIWPLDEGVEYE
jgi:microcystin degradation protein MlrC